MGKKKSVALIINSEWCKGCGICVAFCPQAVLALSPKDKSEVVRPDACIACMMCELRCPDLAIEVRIKSNRTESENGDFGS